MGFDTRRPVTPVVPVVIGDQVLSFRFWKALHEAGVFANPVIPPAVEPGHALIRTSYMATHTDEQLDRVARDLREARPRAGRAPRDPPLELREGADRAPRPVTGNHASQKWAAASAGLLADKGFSLEQISKTSSREVATKLFDAVETLTWRAVNVQPDDLKRLGTAPFRLWEKRADIPGYLLEKSATCSSRTARTPTTDREASMPATATAQSFSRTSPSPKSRSFR